MQTSLEKRRPREGSGAREDRVRFCVPKPKQEKSNKLLPLLLACVVVVGGVFALMLSNQSDLEPSAEANEQDVVLFPEAPACPQTDPAAAARKAVSLEKAALAKRERYRYAARHVRSGKPQMRVLGGFAIDDRVEQDITVDARHVKRKNDPADLQRHAELFRERFAEFELKSARLAIFA